MEDLFREALLAVVARAESLHGSLAAELDARRASATEERWVSGNRGGVLSLVPLVARRPGEGEARWLEPGERERRAERVLVDSEGRPLVQDQPEFGETHAMWRYERDYTESVRLSGFVVEVAWVLHPGGADAVGAVGVDGHERWVERWTWQRGQAVRAERASATIGSWTLNSARSAELGPDGEVARILAGVGERDTELTDATRIGADEWLPALAAGLEQARAIRCTNVVWVAARDAPADLRAETAGMGRELAVALRDAIVTAAAEADVTAPFCVQVVERDRHGAMLPPRVLLASDEWRRGMVAKSHDQGEALRGLWRGVESGVVAQLDLDPLLDDAALRMCAELSRDLSLHSTRAGEERAEPVLEELMDELTALLAEPGAIAGATPDFLGLVMLDRFESVPVNAALRRARRVIGRERVDAFEAAVESRAPGGNVAPPSVGDALRSRDALADLLAAHGLGEHSVRIARDDAAEGLLARPADGSRARSRLGGPPLLPPGVAWPGLAEGTPLTFLGGIDLGELPPEPAWPTGGWLLFYARIAYDEQFFLDEPAVNRPGGPARVFYVPPDEVPLETPSPPQLTHDNYGLLNPRAVAFERFLTLPMHDEAPRALGLDVFEAQAYTVVQNALMEAAEGARMGHWVRGHVVGMQGYAPDEDTELLLHLSHDSALGFEFLDAGTIQFRIPRDALARRDWAAVTIEPDSC